jgi:hypothetical protein
MGARMRNSTDCWDRDLTGVGMNVCPYAMPQDAIPPARDL